MKSKMSSSYSVIAWLELLLLFTHILNLSFSLSLEPHTHSNAWLFKSQGHYVVCPILFKACKHATITSHSLTAFIKQEISYAHLRKDIYFFLTLSNFHYLLLTNSCTTVMAFPGTFHPKSLLHCLCFRKPRCKVTEAQSNLQF